MTAPDGMWIRVWRTRNGYSQDALALELNVRRQTVIAWEKASNVERITYLALTALEADKTLRTIYATRSA